MKLFHLMYSGNNEKMLEANRYLSGEGHIISPKRAFDLYKKCLADDTAGYAEFMIGFMYENRWGIKDVEHNNTNPYDYYAIAAEKGNPYALYKMAFRYLANITDFNDINDWLIPLRNAAEKELPLACFLMHQIYIKMGTPYKGYAYSLFFANKKDQYSCYVLSKLYSQGCIVSKDEFQRKKFLEISKDYRDWLSKVTDENGKELENFKHTRAKTPDVFNDIYANELIYSGSLDEYNKRFAERISEMESFGRYSSEEINYGDKSNGRRHGLTMKLVDYLYDREENQDYLSRYSFKENSIYKSSVSGRKIKDDNIEDIASLTLSYLENNKCPTAAYIIAEAIGYEEDDIIEALDNDRRFVHYGEYYILADTISLTDKEQDMILYQLKMCMDKNKVYTKEFVYTYMRATVPQYLNKWYIDSPYRLYEFLKYKFYGIYEFKEGKIVNIVAVDTVEKRNILEDDIGRAVLKAGIEFVDERDNGGVIKLFDVNRIDDFIESLKDGCANFKYEKEGTAETKYQGYWYTRDIMNSSISNQLRSKINDGLSYKSHHVSKSSSIKVESSNNKVIDIIISMGLEYIDEREQGEYLWVIDENKELDNLMEEFFYKGIEFEFLRGGNKKTWFRSAWYIRDTFE